MKLIYAVIVFTVVFSVPASASLMVFAGEDILTTLASPHPVSAGAAANFDAAAALLGAVGIITFESAPVGAYTNLTVATGVSISGANADGSNLSILNAPHSPSIPTLDGFNTTAGGANYAELVGGTLTFTFSTPTQFFGAYFSGIQTNFFSDVIDFSDGTSVSILLPGSGTSSTAGALDFVGFVDPGKAISSITINAGNPAAGEDFIGIDDVRYQSGVRSVTGAPEPGSFALLAVGGLAIAAAVRRRRKA
jgi:MYXO-CTERM domain-containing protein